MMAFRTLVAAIWIALIVYTVIVISNHGMGLIPIFFGDVAAMNWPGQFNFDFMGFLILSALWTGWRDRFGMPGLALMPVALFGGIGFLGAYLLYLSFKHDTIGAILLGKQATTE